MNQTPFKLAPLPGRLNFPGHSLTLIVKGTFDLIQGGVAVPAAEQSFPTGDEFYPDDEEQKGSVRYESDFAWHKPKADLLLVGKCCPPGGRLVAMCPITFRVGDRSKTLAVFGNRRWEKQFLSRKPTEPEPFATMDLRYENSFGGDRFPANTVGKGFAEEPSGSGETLWPLPNIEDPAHRIVSHGDRPAPAGFGPLGKTWETRRAKLGNYKGAYLKTRWPWFPEDFDWTHFNAAPSDQQVEGFLRGNERLVFENLHPEHARYESQLPGIRVRSFLHRPTHPKSGEVRFEEVPLKLDTLWVDMDTQRLVLVWRGWAPVSSQDFEEEIQDISLKSEPLSQPPASVEDCYREWLLSKAAREQQFQAQSPPPAAELGKAAVIPDAAEQEALAAAEQKQKEAFAAQIKSQTEALYVQLGIDPSSLPPEHQQKQSRLIASLAENDPKKIAESERENVKAELKQAFSKAGVDLDHLPPVSDKAKAEQSRFISELGLDANAIELDPDAGLFASMNAALFPKMGYDPENLEPLIQEAKKLKQQMASNGESAAAPAGTGAAAEPPTAASVKQRLAEGKTLEGADLHGLDFSGLDLSRANFAGANLSGASFRKSVLVEANFSKADLTGADLTEADLTKSNAAGANFTQAIMRQAIFKEADLAGAKFPSADLAKAVLDGAILEDAILADSCLTESSAIRTQFLRADLTGANFQRGLAVKADFTKATLSRANFQKADLTEACVAGAVGHGLDLTGAILTKLRASGGCDLTGARLVEVKAKGSMWKGANLTATDFRHAEMQEALFTSACLVQANLSAADAKFGRFNKANLSQAKFIRMNLFQGNLEKANLTQADFSGSNLYEADFLDAILDRTVTAGANLLMTKLGPK